MSQPIPYNEAIEKMLTHLRRHDEYLIQAGRLMHQSYPAQKVDPSVYERITVPVPLHLAIVLFGLATAMLATHPAPEKTVTEEPADAGA